MTTKLETVYSSLQQLPHEQQDEVAAFLSNLAADLPMSSEHQLTDTDLATAIDAGEASGPAEPFDFDAFIARKLAR